MTICKGHYNIRCFYSFTKSLQARHQLLNTLAETRLLSRYRQLYFVSSFLESKKDQPAIVGAGWHSLPRCQHNEGSQAGFSYILFSIFFLSPTLWVGKMYNSIMNINIYTLYYILPLPYTSHSPHTPSSRTYTLYSLFLFLSLSLSLSHLHLPSSILIRFFPSSLSLSPSLPPPLSSISDTVHYIPTAPSLRTRNSDHVLEKLV